MYNIYIYILCIKCVWNMYELSITYNELCIECVKQIYKICINYEWNMYELYKKCINYE